MLNLLSPHAFFLPRNAPKPVIGRVSAQDPAGELMIVLRPPSRLDRGTPPPESPPV